MFDPYLGVLQSDPHIEGCLLGKTVFRGRQIDLRVDPDGSDLGNCLALAKELVRSLPMLDTKARAVAAGKLLEAYNEHWRMFQRARADGTTEEVTNPALSQSQFGDRLELEAISVTGEMLEFCFGDDGLFAGHSVFVSAFDGMDFTDTDALIFG